MYNPKYKYLKSFSVAKIDIFNIFLNDKESIKYFDLNDKKYVNEV